MLNATTQARLEEAAGILDDYHADPKTRKNFDIDTWFAKSESKDETLCGTVACACGVIASQPNVRRRGFKFEINKWTDTEYSKKLKKDVKVKHTDGYIIYRDPKTGNTYESFGAAAAYFGIEEHEAQRLFSSVGYEQQRVTAKTVAVAIRRFIKEQNKQLKQAA